MKRLDVIQQAIDAIGAGVYLEIGVFTGGVFLRIRANRKIAVDPEIRIPTLTKLRFLIRNPSNLNNTYLETTSNEFFGKHSSLIAQSGVDVAFIDGLHQYEQALTDIENCLRYLNPNGIVIIHDCNPPNEAAALRAMSPEEAAATNHPAWTGEWCGDTYKALLQLRATHDDLEIFIIDCDCGLGIVRRGEAEASLDLSVAQVREMSYAEFDTHRNRLLNLKTTVYFKEWIARLATETGAS